MRKKHLEHHNTERIGWLRAAVLGANDGIVSTASLIVGVASANSGKEAIVLSGVAGLVAGAMSMAAGEYVSVSSQADSEKAELKKEMTELRENPEVEKEELSQIYVERGLSEDLARKVSEQLMSKDALKAHARDELGITDYSAANPIQAAVASAASFSIGAALPLVVVYISPLENVVYAVSAASLLFLMSLGFVAAKAGGANAIRGVIRVGFWGAFAMVATALIGHLFHVNIN